MEHTFLITQNFLNDTAYFTVVDGTTLRIGDITRWCQDNTKTWNGYWNHKNEYVINVKSDEDAIAFKLRWL